MTELWAIADICAWAKLSRSAVYKIIYRHGFPSAIRIDGGHPRWVKEEICAYFGKPAEPFKGRPPSENKNRGSRRKALHLELLGKRTAVYRHYDKDDKLLYVGIAVNPLSRSANHESVSLWYWMVAKITIEWHQDRKTAEEAEIIAIREEAPIYNVKDVPNAALAA